jgi:hypothetical protein
MALSPWARGASSLLVAGWSCSRPGPAAREGDGSASSSRVEQHAAVSADTPDALADSKTPRPDERPAPSFPEPIVKLLESGALPRHRLRYAWAVGKQESLLLEMRTALVGARTEGQILDVPLPAVRIAIVIDSRSVADDGTLTYGWRVTSTGVANDDRMAPQVAEGMRSEAVAVEHLSGTGVVSSRGLGRDLDVSASESGEAITARPIALQILEVLRNVAAPLPDDEVGIGARWQRVSDLAVEGARTTQTDFFTLRGLDGSHGTLDDALEQTAPEQALSVPGMANGSRAQMGSMIASGSATTKFDLSRLVPATRFEGTTTMTLTSDGTPGSEPRTTMVLRVGVDVTGTVR